MIGLDTGHLVYNYGTKLQAYAMQTLLEKSGETVEIIQWHQKNFGIFNRVADSVKRIKKTYERYGLKINYGRKALKRYQALDSFNKKFHIHKYYGTFENMKEYTKHYSKVFCGSDQAWLPGNVMRHWYTLEYCENEIFKAAYAPSFGIDQIDEQYVEQYRYFLSRMDSLSVREKSGKNIIKELIGKDVPVVLDPTLLLEKEEWEALRKESGMKLPTDEPYVFCYFLGRNPVHRECVKDFVKEKAYKIVNLQHFTGFCEADRVFADYNLYNVTPQDFLNLISQAAYVCTDSFHCTAFSIQYHKKFSTFPRFNNDDKASTNSRLYTLLKQLGLEDRIVMSKSIDESFIDYASVEAELKKYRDSSSTYLKQAIGGIRNV